MILKDKIKNGLPFTGILNDTFVTELKFKITEFNETAKIYAIRQFIDKLSNYNFILGRDILHELGL